MKNPRAAAKELSVDKYHADWPHIPLVELQSSAVALPHLDENKNPTETLVLLHKRRISSAALKGEEPVNICAACKHAFQGRNPSASKSKFCFANWNWLGRHPPLLRDSTLGHQLLLALGRPVSTKVYLSSKGKDETVRQGAETWKKKFLQQGMQGTAIVFGNASADDAMRSFPPSADVVQDCFAAVFTGPEKPTSEQAAIMASTS